MASQKDSEEPLRVLWDVNRAHSREDVISGLLHDGSPVALPKQPIISTCDECALQSQVLTCFSWKLCIHTHLTEMLKNHQSMKNEFSLSEC